jgi:ADP-ribose pyrophosphatase
VPASGPKGRREVRVALKTGVRPPVFLRRRLTLTQPDERLFGAIAEVAAGMLEAEDVGPAGISSRAAAECAEEIGVFVDVADVATLGASSFPTPGVTDEKVYFRAAEAPLDRRGTPSGDGTVMEQGGGVVVMGLADAIEACRRGDIPDMKTEVALLRLCDLIGFVPSLGVFVDEMPAALRRGWRPLGISSAAKPVARGTSRRGGSKRR